MKPGDQKNWRLQVLEEISSTNALCLERARDGDPGRLWVRADRQTAARGSRGRSWESGFGNLLASALLRFPKDSTKLHELTFVASLAIRDAIYALQGAQFANVALKWPNDVLLNGRKLSGILLESHILHEHRYVIIGIGLNIAAHPENTLHPATSLSAEGISATPQSLLEHLSAALDTRIEQWLGPEGSARTRQAWLDAATGIGAPVEIRLPDAPDGVPLRGIFRGLDEGGLMLVETENGTLRKISVADIFFTPGYDRNDKRHGK
jgi:BirA family biotin operon repressor/biotin-[acetyl-CoA-carboxylase] ligase